MRSQRNIWLLSILLASTWKLILSADVDDATIKALLKRVPELPVIPTQNGLYIFVPTQCKMEENITNQHDNSDQNQKNLQGSQLAQASKFSFPQMRGVNRAGLEYSCIKGFGIFDGPSDDASIQAIKKWNAEIVRLPLNEDCWLSTNGVNNPFVGANYRSAVIDYVRRLRKNGLSVIIDLHWTGGVYSGPGHIECSDMAAKCQKPMPDAENAPKFWESVAKEFKDDNNIIFEVFNNPFPDKVIQNKASAWKCWKNGGDACPGFGYKVAGMQELVNAVRKTGATNPVMVPGIRSANDLSKWKEYVPNDPKNKIIASWHSFKESECNTDSCWNKEIAPVAKDFPLIVAEIGEKGCTHSYINKLMDWLDGKHISYLGWTWNTWDCSTGPSLISDYNGTPTEFGKGLYERLKVKGKTTVSTGDGSGSQGTKADTGVPKTGSVNSSHKKQLRGVNRSGAEYSCVKDLGIFEGPVDDNAVKTMKTWNINIVRVPLNEDCWLGINGHTPAFSGENYKKAVSDYVSILRKNDMKVILDLHWTDGIYGGPGQGECYDQTAKCQKPMPDKENAPKFWRSVAEKFMNDDGIIFDLFNEPFPDMVMHDKSAAWKCLRDGGNACSGFQYEVAGMQDLVNAVRSTGAKNKVMVGGLTWTNDLSQWSQHRPEDPANNIAASWHSYDFNACNHKECWESQIAPLAAKYEVIVGEVGQHSCAHDYTDGLMDWLDDKNISFLSWTWNAWNCLGPSLLLDYNGNPTEYGKGLKNHLTK